MDEKISIRDTGQENTERNDPNDDTVSDIPNHTFLFLILYIQENFYEITFIMDTLSIYQLC